jgi:hypothetical protein
MLRRIGDEYVFYMLDEAIDLLPVRKLAKLVGQYMDVRQLRPEPVAGATQRSLLEAVKVFYASSRAGRYYVNFNVNSKNCTESSTGTLAFVAQCRRLLDRCVAARTRRDVAKTREAFDTIAALLRHIDEGHDDVVFFADEGGSWQVRGDWRKLFPAWFRCLALTAEPEEFARVVVEAIDHFEHFARADHLATARRAANAAQHKALEVRARSRDPAQRARGRG